MIQKSMQKGVHRSIFNGKTIGEILLCNSREDWLNKL